MAKLKLKFIHEYRDRHGKLRRYFRRGNKKGPLPGDVGSNEFMAAYAKYLDGQKPLPVTVKAEGSFGRLINEYYGSRNFLNLKQSSRQKYRSILEPLAKTHGDRGVDLTHKAAAKLISDIGIRRPSMANLTKSVLRTLMQFAVRQGYRDDNPITGIERFRGGSHHTWSEGELLQFEQRWPLGTRERLAYALLLYTAQRVGDVCKMTRADIANGELHVIQEKTGTELFLPVTPELELALKAFPARGLSLIGKANGKPINRAGLSKLIREAVEKAGLPAKCVPHGLRKAALRRLAESGATEKQIGAWSGHKSLREIQRYTEAANQRRLAKDALKK